MISKPSDGVLDSLQLEGPWLLDRGPGIFFFDLYIEMFPKVDLRDLGMCVLNCPLRIRSPPARRHDPTQAEYRLLGTAQKLVDLSFSKSVSFVVALALDGDPFSRYPPCHEINTNVTPIEAG